jgi:hypothetical protein
VQGRFAKRGAGLEGAATGAGHGHFFVIGVNAGFHGFGYIPGF